MWAAMDSMWSIRTWSAAAGLSSSTSLGSVAFAYALLKCGTPADFSRQPERRLRLTLGLRKTDGRWTVAHEHHSFPDTTP